MDKMVLKGVVGVGLSDGANSEKKEKVTDSEKEGEKGGVSVMDPTQTLSYVLTSTKADVTSSITDSNTDDIPSTRTITTIIDPSTPACPEITLCVMAACHSLMVAPESGAVVGDPLEIATMESSGFQFIRYVTCCNELVRYDWMRSFTPCVLFSFVMKPFGMCSHATYLID